MDDDREFLIPQEGNRTAQGLKVYYDAGAEAEIDIIAVPGFAAEPERNWTWFAEGGKDRDTSKDFNWLSHKNGLQKEFPRSRIMIHQYNSQPGGSNRVDTTIYHLADDLLFILKQKRKNREECPMIFLGHSMGGLLVAQVLIAANARLDENEAFLRCFGACMFFGTPFQGVEHVDVALENIRERRGSKMYEYMLSTFLRPGSKSLSQLKDNFLRARERLRNHDVRIDLLSVFETQHPEYDKNNKPKTLEVTENSAVLRGFESYGIARTHADLVRYANEHEHDYREILIPKMQNLILAAIARALHKNNTENNCITMEEGRKWELVVKWLSPPNFAVEHEEACEKHEDHENTGKWLIQSRKFKRFKKSFGSHLWLNGKSGCGKTVLFSTVVQDIQCFCAKSELKIGLAAFYFTFRDQDKQSYSRMLLSLLYQLGRKHNVQHVLWEAYQKSDKQPLTPMSRRLQENLLVSLSEHYEQIFLCLDAIDECQMDGRARGIALDGVERLVKTTQKIKLFVTSQPLPDIAYMMKALNAEVIRIDERFVGPDIRRFVDKAVQHRDFKRLAVKTKDTIIERLTEKSDCSFRWAAVQLDAIRSLVPKNQHRIDEVLSNLPKTLNDTYNRMLAQIDEKNRDHAITLLHCLLFSERPMTLCELLEVSLVTDSRDSELNFEDRGDYNDVSILLTGLVVEIEAKRDLIDSDWLARGLNDQRGECLLQLAHSSVREFLLQSACLKPEWAVFKQEKGHEILAETCLIYLFYWIDNSRSQSRSIHYPFVGYATNYWYRHSAKKPPDANWSKEIALLSSSKRMYSWLSESDYGRSAPGYDKIGFWINALPKKYFFRAKIYHASYLGLTGVVKTMLRSMNPGDIEEEGYYGSPLHAASANGDLEIVKELLAYGAQPDQKARGDGATALMRASTSGKCSAAALLLSSGAKVDAESTKGYTALMGASKQCQHSVVQLLLDQGAEINHRSIRKETALIFAAQTRHSDVVMLLLAKGADANACSSSGHNALIEATRRGNCESVRLLLAYGAAVDNAGVGGLTALHEASKRRDIGILQLLLRAGAGIDTPSDNGSTAIIYATSKSFKGIKGYRKFVQESPESFVRILLDSGANVNATSKRGDTALLNASINGYSKAVQLLLENHANFNPVLAFANSLKMAIAYGHTQIAKLLIKSGADVNYKYKEDYKNFSPSVLILASREGDIETVRMLVENGADLNTQTEGCEPDDTALIAASADGYLEIVTILLDAGAEVDLKPSGGRTALQSSMLMNQVEVTDLLLARGAECDPRHELLYACQQGRMSRVRTLLGSGIDSNWRDEFGDTALTKSLKHPDIVELLLQHGADAILENNQGCTALAMVAGINESIEGFGMFVGAPEKYAKTLSLLLFCIDHEDSRSEEALRKALLFAAQAGVPTHVNMILNAGCDPNSRDSDGQSALMKAARASDFKSVRLLIKAGANVHAVDHDGKDALIVLMEGHGVPTQRSDILNLLLENHIKVDREDSNGNTALSTIMNHWISLQFSFGQLEIYANDFDQAKTLLENGATFKENLRYSEASFARQIMGETEFEEQYKLSPWYAEFTARFAEFTYEIFREERDRFFVDDEGSDDLDMKLRMQQF